MNKLNLPLLILTIMSFILITPKLLNAQVKMKHSYCTITHLEIDSLTHNNLEFDWSYNGNPTYYELQTKYCDLAFNDENCITDLWTEVPDAFEQNLFEPCKTYSFRMMMICEEDTLYSNEVDYFFEDGTCNSCNYNDWLQQIWGWNNRCDYSCLSSVELIEFNGTQYVAAWGMYLGCTCGTEIFNCDGSILCFEGGFGGCGNCGEFGIAGNYTVIEKIWDRYEDCDIYEEDFDICELYPDFGACCAEGTERWYYNTTTSECEIFLWSGCGGNPNNFESYEICMEGCGQQTANCDYSSWLSGEWFMQQDCDFCPFTVELIEFNGNQYIAMWENVSTQIACNDFMSVVYNCDGSIFCQQGGFVGFNECTEAGLPFNYTVLETLYSYNNDCITCPESCTCSLPFDPGVCSSEGVERWYYDAEASTCLSFAYSGCGGNPNNFNSFEACMQACDQQTLSCPPVLNLGAVQLQNETYQADETLMYYGTIPPIGNVNLKAGERIQLLPGFNSGFNNEVNIYIEPCD